MPVLKEKPIVKFYCYDYVSARFNAMHLVDSSRDYCKKMTCPIEELWDKDGFIFIELDDIIIRIYKNKEDKNNGEAED